MRTNSTVLGACGLVFDGHSCHNGFGTVLSDMLCSLLSAGFGTIDSNLTAESTSACFGMSAGHRLCMLKSTTAASAEGVGHDDH